MLQHLRSKHARGLALICAACTLAVTIPFLSSIAFSLIYPLLERKYPGRVPRRVPIVSEIFEAYRRAEWRLSTDLQLWGRKGHLPPNVVFLPIDNASVQIDEPAADLDRSPALQLMAKQGFPYAHALYPMILDRLFNAGAKVVAFDLLFPTAREGDEDFRAALEKYRPGAVIGMNLITVDENGFKPTLALPNPSLLPAGNGSDPRLGFVNFRAEEEDAQVRYALFRTTLLEYFGQGSGAGQAELWSLSAQMARQAGFESLVPADHDSHMIRFVMDSELKPISLHSIFVEDLWNHPPLNGGAFFKDKIVFIGPYGNWVKDELETPFGLMLGPQIHLSALSSILNHDFLRESSPLVDVLVILAAGVVAWLVSIRINNPLLRSAALLALAATYIAGAFLLFNTAGFCLKLLSPNLALLASGGVGLVWERLAEQRERLRVRRTLERYVSRDVVKEVLDNPASFLHTLGGERRRISILFSDVRGFTTMTESADATLLVKQLNEYFTEMVRIVFENHGTLDKFIGDAVMASWGGIGARGEAADAQSAVTAALSMLRELKRLNVGWKARGMIELKVGIGVNHGEAICGHLGSEQKQEFSAIGDAVNLASRLEGATKEFHVDILLGENTAPLVRDTMTVRTVDLLQVKGKTKPVEVFTVLDEAAPAWLPVWEEGVRLYRARQFTEAERCFATAAQAQPEDWLIQEYLRRVREYQTEPPGAEWDGVHVLTKK